MYAFKSNVWGRINQLQWLKDEYWFILIVMQIIDWFHFQSQSTSSNVLTAEYLGEWVQKDEWTIIINLIMKLKKDYIPEWQKAYINYELLVSVLSPFKEATRMISPHNLLSQILNNSNA